MTDSIKDRLDGTFDEAKGRGKSAWGEVTDDEQTQAEGEQDQASGKVKQGMADAKDKLGDLKDKVTD